MSNYEKLALYKANDLTVASTTANWGLFTNVTSTFDATETSMYSEVISLASSTGFGGASLGNQTERYLVAIATDKVTSSGTVYDDQTSAKRTDHMNNNRSLNDIFTSEGSVYTFTPNHTSFSAAQTSIEDDGKHFISSTWAIGADTYNVYYLIIDKNNLGSGSGSSSSSGTSLTSWAYSSQSATDPDILIDWSTPTPDFSITQDTTDWTTDLDSAITTAGLNKQNLINDFLYEHHELYRTTETNKQNNLIDYIKYRIEKE